MCALTKLNLCTCACTYISIYIYIYIPALHLVGQCLFGMVGPSYVNLIYMCVDMVKHKNMAVSALDHAHRHFVCGAFVTSPVTLICQRWTERMFQSPNLLYSSVCIQLHSMGNGSVRASVYRTQIQNYH